MIAASAALLALLPSAAFALSFKPAPGSPVGGYNYASNVAAADFDNDGFDDLAIGAEGTQPGLHVWLSDGDGTFTEASSSPLFTTMSPIVNAADLNGDGDADLVAGDQNPQVFLGNGDGSFTPVDSLALASYTRDSVITTINTADDYPDLVFPGPGTFQVAYGNGFGSFFLSPAVIVDTPGVGVFESIAAGDFDGDSDRDLAFGNYPIPFDSENRSSWGVYLVSGDGGGGFSDDVPGSPLLMPDASLPKSMAGGQLTEGSVADELVVSSSSDAGVTFSHDPGGFLSLNPLGNFPAARFPLDTEVVDLDGDGHTDALTSGFGAASIAVSLGDGSGSLTAAAGSPYSLGASNYFPDRLAVGDFNGDAASDVAVTSASNSPDNIHGVAVMLNSPELVSDPQTGDAGKVRVGDARTFDLTVTNSGVPDASVGPVALSGPGASAFTVVDVPEVGCAPGTLGPAGSCTVRLRFSPESVGTSQATVSIPWDAGDLAIPVTGTGVATPALRVRARPAVARPGRLVRVQTTITNLGELPVDKVRVTARAPRRVAAVKGARTVATIAPGQSARVSLRVKVNRKARPGSRIKVRLTAAGPYAVTARSSVRIRVR